MSLPKGEPSFLTVSQKERAAKCSALRVSKKPPTVKMRIKKPSPGGKVAFARNEQMTDEGTIFINIAKRLLRKAF